MKYIVDRIEDNIAVCETIEKEKITFEIDKLYKGVKEGDFFEFVNGKCVFLENDTKEARKKNIILQNNLFDD